MATILDMVRVMEQMEAAARRAYGFSDLHAQLARAAEQVHRVGDVQAQVARATEQFRSVSDILQEARIQMQMRDEMLRARTGALSVLATPAFDASQAVAKMLGRVAVDRQLVDVTAKMSRDWSAVLRTSELLHQRAFLPVEAHLARIYELSSVTEAALLRVRPEVMGSRLGLDGPDRAELLARHDQFGTAYRSFYDEVAKDELTVIELPKPLTELPAAEFVNQAALVVSTSEADEDEASAEAEREVTNELAAEAADHLTTLVSGLDNDLATLLRGARAACDARQPDYVRHFSSSFRELFTQVLHHLAPDDQVRGWTQDESHYHQKRPTRRARLLYIVRHVGQLFGGFLEADVDAALKFLDSFQKGTHGVRPDFSEEEIVSMSRRMEGLLRLMLIVQQVQL